MNLVQSLTISLETGNTKFNLNIYEYAIAMLNHCVDKILFSTKVKIWRIVGNVSDILSCLGDKKSYPFSLRYLTSSESQFCYI